jgi:hypothetical protein
MLKQLLSVSDVNQLKTGDQLTDHPELSLGKMYTIGNVSHGLVYAIFDNGRLELKLLKTDELPDSPWWVRVYPDGGSDMAGSYSI